MKIYDSRCDSRMNVFMSGQPGHLEELFGPLLHQYGNLNMKCLGGCRMNRIEENQQGLGKI